MATVIPAPAQRQSKLQGLAEAVALYVTRKEERERAEAAARQNRMAVDSITSLGIEQGVFPEGTTFGNAPVKSVLEAYDTAFNYWKVNDEQAAAAEAATVAAGRDAEAATTGFERDLFLQDDRQAATAEQGELSRAHQTQENIRADRHESSEGALDRASRESIAAQRIAATTAAAAETPLTPEQEAMAAASGLDPTDRAQRHAAVILETSQDSLRDDALALYAKGSPALQGLMFEFEDHDKVQMYNQLRVTTETLIVDGGKSGQPITFNHAFNLAVDKLANGNIFPDGMTKATEMSKWLRERGWPLDTVNRYMGRIQEAQAVQQAAEVAATGQVISSPDTSAPPVNPAATVSEPEGSLPAEPPPQGENVTRSQYKAALENLSKFSQRIKQALPKRTATKANQASAGGKPPEQSVSVEQYTTALEAFEDMRSQLETIIPDVSSPEVPKSVPQRAPPQRSESTNRYPPITSLTSAVEEFEAIRARLEEISVQPVPSRVDYYKAIRELEQFRERLNAILPPDTATRVNQERAAGEPPARSVNTQQYPTPTQRARALRELEQYQGRTADPLAAIRKAAGL